MKLERRLEAHEVHTTLATKVPAVEPIPVLEFMPRLPPGQEVVMISQLPVRRPIDALVNIGREEQRPTVGAFADRQVLEELPGLELHSRLVDGDVAGVGEQRRRLRASVGVQRHEFGSARFGPRLPREGNGFVLGIPIRNEDE